MLKIFRLKELIIILFALGLTFNLKATEAASSILESGKLSEVSGDYEEAIKLYSKVISMDSNNYDANLYLGNVYHIQNKYSKALTFYHKAIRIDSSRAEAYFYRGNLQIDLGSVFGAVNDYTLALEKDPNDMRIYMCRGFAFANMGDFYNAVNDYSIAVQLNPEASKSYYNMAKTQGILENVTLACDKITELKEEGSVRAELVYLNFCLN